MTTADLLEAIRTDIKVNLKQEILAELEPEIQRRLYANIFNFYSCIETGERKPSVDTAKKIAEALRFDWTKFYEEESEERR